MRALFRPALNGGEASDWLRPTPCQREGNKLPKGAYQQGDGFSTGVPLSEHLARVPSSQRGSSHVSSQGKEAASVTHDIYHMSSWAKILCSLPRVDIFLCPDVPHGCTATSQLSSPLEL